MPALRTPSRSFANFIADEPTLVSALTMARKFVADVMADPFGAGYCLTFCGKSGTGKTMLAEIIVHELRWNRWATCEAIKPVIRSGALVDFTCGIFDMRKVSDGFKAGKWGAVEAMEEKQLAVLDDVGADHDPSKVTASKVDRVLRSRRGRWTIVTANLPLAEIAEKLDARIASFIIRDENRFVEIAANDFALRKFKK